MLLSLRASKERIRSQKIDKILTGKYTGNTLLCSNYGLAIFFLTFNVIGRIFTECAADWH